MRAIRSFAVRASLPEPLRPLTSIGLNLRWTWDRRTVDLFRWIDPDAWDAADHDPIRMIGLVPRARLEELAEDGPFLSFLADVHADLDKYMSEPRWFGSRRASSPLSLVAYFSPEFALSEALPIYSGGLGVLAGDHLKAASDLGVPMAGVGLLYRQGYFRQRLNADGWQQELYPPLDPHAMPLTLLAGDDGAPLTVEVDLAGARCVAQIWRAQVGRVPLLLLDCDVEVNEPDERAVTDRLYGGATEHRLRQEIVLGIGGVRALEVAGFEPSVFHSNEGHAGFLGLERIRTLVQRDGLTFPEAVEAVRASSVFTTHTPVSAGIDVYGVDLMQQYFAAFAKECDVAFDDLMALGSAQRPDEPGAGERFNMAVMGLRLAGRSNAVSQLHGRVSRAMFSPLWPDVPEHEVPIASITNGVHASTWIGDKIAEVLARKLGRAWVGTGEARWERVADVPDAELWRAREKARAQLVYFVRARLRAQLLDRDVPEGDTGWTDEVFDPGILTIGFARRFAQYKRATLLLSDPERLKRLVLSPEQPVQIVFAGKAHPADDGGKELVRALVHLSSDPDVRGRIAFIEDYDMEAGRILTQGVDVWLNNPRRPLEACGTSGMKAALNGVLNCSILDGWWDECYDGRNGWAIGGAETYDDPEYQDRVDARSLFAVLEREIVPRFYDRSEGPVPRRWVERMKASIAGLSPYVTAARMVRQYVDELYAPAAQQGVSLAASGHERARALAAWKRAVRAAWDDVAVLDVEGDVVPSELGEDRRVAATVRLGRLTPDDVCVQLVHGSVGANGELVEHALAELRPGPWADGVCTYSGTFTAAAAGLYGYTVRIVPAHRDLITRMDLGLVTWA
ncbi:MAG TPA: alpha-glucan family phosphorylase [Actinomycetota bacterium]|nr:alpha-glucan family phosphorylase [Actinomycetota bacterium]